MSYRNPFLATLTVAALGIPSSSALAGGLEDPGCWTDYNEAYKSSLAETKRLQKDFQFYTSLESPYISKEDRDLTAVLNWANGDKNAYAASGTGTLGCLISGGVASGLGLVPGGQLPAIALYGLGCGGSLLAAATIVKEGEAEAARREAEASESDDFRNGKVDFKDAFNRRMVPTRINKMVDIASSIEDVSLERMDRLAVTVLMSGNNPAHGENWGLGNSWLHDNELTYRIMRDLVVSRLKDEPSIGVFDERAVDDVLASLRRVTEAGKSACEGGKTNITLPQLVAIIVKRLKESGKVRAHRATAHVSSIYRKEPMAGVIDPMTGLKKDSAGKSLNPR
jgi:hypothetical protein